MEEIAERDRTAAGDVFSEAVVEFTTHIRDRVVSCRWDAGRVTGDAELLHRVQRSAGDSHWHRSPTTVAEAVRAAVACPVAIHVLPAPARRSPAGPPPELAPRHGSVASSA